MRVNLEASHGFGALGEEDFNRINGMGGDEQDLKEGQPPFFPLDPLQNPVNPVESYPVDPAYPVIRSWFFPEFQQD